MSVGPIEVRGVPGVRDRQRRIGVDRLPHLRIEMRNPPEWGRIYDSLFDGVGLDTAAGDLEVDSMIRVE